MSLQVRSSSFFYLAEGRMPKSKELLSLCRNVGTDQRSARLGCLCFSPHLAPLPIFLIILFPASLSFLPPFQWRLNSSPMLFCLLTRPHFPVIFIPFLSLLVDQCIFFFPLLAPVFASSLLHSFQCSCQQKRPTRSCGGCAGPTFFWRK